MRYGLHMGRDLHLLEVGPHFSSRPEGTSTRGSLALSSFEMFRWANVHHPASDASRNPVNPHRRRSASAAPAARSVPLVRLLREGSAPLLHHQHE